MISKRYKRPARPQENLRQFALNNSKGVDSTKAPTDFDTISRSNNLVVNPDGSLSLRKPIEYVDCTERAADVQQFYLYDNSHKLEVVGNTFSITESTGQPLRIEARYTGYAGDMYSKTYSNRVENLIFPNGDIAVVNLNSATVLGNCNVDVSQFGERAIPSEMYDRIEPVPRYVKIHYSDVEELWVLEIIPPEVNVLTTADGEIPLNPNLTLDNPFAVRDVYDATVPSIRGIMAYAYSKLENGKAVYVPQTYKDFTGQPISTEQGSVRVLVYTPDDDDDDDDSENSMENSTGSLGPFGFKTNAVLRKKGYSYVENTSKLLLNFSGLTETIVRVSLEGTCTVKTYAQNTSGTPYTWIRKTFTYERTLSVSTDLPDIELPWDISTEIRLVFGVLTVDWDVVCTYSFLTSDDATQIRIADITESAKLTRYRPVTVLKDTGFDVVLKAFCNLPKANKRYYAAWSKSIDGVSWEQIDFQHTESSILVRELDPMWRPAENVEDKDQVKDYIERYYYPIYGDSEYDGAFTMTSPILYERVDVLNIQYTPNEAPTYRFKIIAVEKLIEDDPEWDSSKQDVQQFRVYATVGQSEYTPVYGKNFEFTTLEFDNAVYGKKLYSKKALYSYGSEKFFNNIFVSDIDSFITPLYNVIDLDTHAASQATCLVPWRDYLVSATDNAIYLHTRATDGFLTKTVNTSIGISEQDSRCCKAVLNGILFKSGPKVYQLYPNLYSGDDSTLNLTEISRAVEDYLEEYIVKDDLPFAFSTESEYVLMLPNAKDTTCLRYDYSSKLWTVCTYPIVATDYKIVNIDDIRIFGKFGTSSAEFRFDSSVKTDVYGDVMPSGVIPIEFEWDTGQKTDNISIAKQFVESKIVFATEDLIEAFPMELTVAIDGDPHVTVLDVNSDAPFWKTDDSKGVLNTALRLRNSESSGVLRQLIVRYSGKGRSVRHILSGSPTSNFRLYETYVRYKTLNIKR